MSRHKEELALLQVSKNMQLPDMMVRTEVKARLADEWSELIRSKELGPWIMATLEESYYQARQTDDQRIRIV